VLGDVTETIYALPADEEDEEEFKASFPLSSSLSQL
jgi:hypothetical protein